MLLTVSHGTLSSSNTGMCEDLLIDAGYEPDEHSDVVEAMAFAADLAAVDAAYEVLREHGLLTLADRERALPGEDGTDG